MLAVDFVIGMPNDTAARHGAPNATNAQSIRTAVQTGNVTLHQVSAKKTGGSGGLGGAQNSTATAARAEYDGATDTLTLTGKPLFRDDNLEMTAERFAVGRAAGNVLATGSVQTTVRSGNPAGSGGSVERKPADACHCSPGTGAARFADGDFHRSGTAMAGREFRGGASD